MMTKCDCRQSDETKDMLPLIEEFISWLDSYGEISYDHQSYYVGSFGRWAKRFYYRHPGLGVVAVAPMVLSEGFLPAGRTLFWKRQRLPVADAHYAMGFAHLYSATGEKQWYLKARHFLEVLLQTRCPGYEDFCWGYPFHWETKTGTIPAGTPIITTTPYVYEAFHTLYDIDGDRRWSDVMRSISEHVTKDIKDFETSSDAATCSYTPNDRGGVINASAYRAFLLTHASHFFGDPAYQDTASRNLNFVLQNQNHDGSWYYSIDGVRNFIDHFHTCFILKSLAKIEVLLPGENIKNAIDTGVDYYVRNLFDENGLPKPFARKPRITVYRQELYDYAECLNLSLLLKERNSSLEELALATLADLFNDWVKKDGSIRSRRLLLGWDNVPMHRWGQSQIFRALCLLHLQSSTYHTWEKN